MTTVVVDTESIIAGNFEGESRVLDLGQPVEVFPANFTCAQPISGL